MKKIVFMVESLKVDSDLFTLTLWVGQWAHK